jgi:large subunit ribosomal protein L9
MKVILIQDVENLGSEGDIVTVKDGYGRNFLIPKRLALLATEGTIRARQEELRQAAHKIAQKKGAAEQLAKRLAEEEVVVTARVGEENRIFGTITTQQIAVALAERGIEVDRRKITLSEDVRVVGVYPATVRLHPEVLAEFKVKVEPLNTEAA